MVDEYKYALHIIETVLLKRFQDREIDKAKLYRCLERAGDTSSATELIKLAELYSIYITLPSQTERHDE